MENVWEEIFDTNYQLQKMEYYIVVSHKDKDRYWVKREGKINYHCHDFSNFLLHNIDNIKQNSKITYLQFDSALVRYVRREIKIVK